MTSSPLVLSLFPRHDVSLVEQEVEGSWDHFISSLKMPLEANVSKADLPLWSPARFREGHRIERNVERVSALVLDIDESPVPSDDDLADALDGVLAFIHSSSSATKDAPRWRGIVALSRPVTADEYRALWVVFTRTLPFPVGQAAKDPSRAWYFPRRGVDGFFDSFELEGAPLDVDYLLSKLPPLPAPGAANTPTYPGDVEAGSAEHAHRLRLYEKYLRTTPPCIQGNSGDARLFEVVQHGAYDLQLPTDDVLHLVRDVFDPRCVPPWGGELEERVHHKAHSAKTTSQRPRAEPVPHDLGHLVLEMPPAPAKGVLGEAVRAAAANELGIVWGGWDQEVKPPEYLVSPLFPENKVIMLVAEGGSLKSWTVDDIGISVATGSPWLGRYLVKEGRVLIIDYEDGLHEKRRRHRMLRPNAPDIPNLGYLYCPSDLEDVDFWKRLIPLGLRLLIIDSLAAGMGADIEENSAEAAQSIKAAGRFTEASPGTTVLIVHHTSKTGSIRGHSKIRDQVDCAFKFEAVSETDSVKRMRMFCDKPGPQRKPAPVNLELSDDGLKWFDDEAQELGRNATKEVDVRSAILLAIEAHELFNYRELAQKTGIARDKVQSELGILRERGDIVKGPSGRLLPGATAEARILKALGDTEKPFRTASQLATAAGAKTASVEQAITDGLLTWSSSDRECRYLIRVSR